MGESFFDYLKTKERHGDGETVAENSESTAERDCVTEFAEARERLNSETDDESSAENEKNESDDAESLGIIEDKSDENESLESADVLSRDFFEDEEQENFAAEQSDDFSSEENRCDSETDSGEKEEDVEATPCDDEFSTEETSNPTATPPEELFVGQADEGATRSTDTTDATATESKDNTSTDTTATESNAEAEAEQNEEDLKEQYRQRKIANLFSKIDMDCTMPNLSSAEIADRAEQAKLYGLSSVCILASRMKMFKRQSREQNFCAVIAYPSGEMTEKSKICEIREAAKHGAREIDVFFRISALKDEKRKNIAKSLKKYRFVIGKKKIFKISVDSDMITADEAEFIVAAASDAKIDYIVVRNCRKSDERTKLFYSGLCAGKCKLEFADCAEDLASWEKMNAIGTERFLLKNALSVADTMREEINRE